LKKFPITKTFIKLEKPPISASTVTKIPIGISLFFEPNDLQIISSRRFMKFSVIKNNIIGTTMFSDEMRKTSVTKIINNPIDVVINVLKSLFDFPLNNHLK